jgi:tellurite resistance protein TerC
MEKSTLYMSYKVAKRIAIASIGVTVLLIGIALLVLPGPAFIVIPTGLAILGLEFAWARRWLDKMKTSTDYAFSSFKREPKETTKKNSNSIIE